MSIYDEVLLSVISLMKAVEPDSSVYIGALPPDNALSIAWGSTEYSPFVNKTTAAVELTAVFNGKSTDENLLSEKMGEIHQYLSQLTEYPVTENYQITNIQTVSVPTLIGREENDQILHGSSLEVKFYLK